MARSTIPMQYKMRKTSAKCGHVLSLYVLTGLYFQDAKDVRGGEGGRGKSAPNTCTMVCVFLLFIYSES